MFLSRSYGGAFATSVALIVLLGARTGVSDPGSQLEETSSATRLCDMDLRDAELVHDKDLKGVSASELPTVLICAAEALRLDGREADAETLLLRAVDVSNRAGMDEQLGDSLRELGKLYAGQRRVGELQETWDRLSDLGKRSPSAADRLILVRSMIAFAKHAYDDQDFETAISLMSRVEGYHGGQEYGSEALDPDWLPDLYRAAGNGEHARRIHEARVADAHAVGEPLVLAERLEHYADFLDAEGRSEEAARIREEASRLQKERMEVLESDEYWRNRLTK